MTTTSSNEAPAGSTTTKPGLPAGALRSGLAWGWLACLLTILPSPGAAASCDELEAQLMRETGNQRHQTATNFIAQGCLGTSSEVWSAIHNGVWSDGDSLATADARSSLVRFAMLKGFVDAETLAVQVLQSGLWPDGSELVLDEGIVMVQGLEARLTPYRVGLLLDIYEQIPDERVRKSVVQTLRATQRPEAILPALDAFWHDVGDLQAVANTSIGLQPEQDPNKVLTRLARTLDDPVHLEWVRRLAEEKDVAEALEALQSRK